MDNEIIAGWRHGAHIHDANGNISKIIGVVALGGHSDLARPQARLKNMKPSRPA